MAAEFDLAEELRTYNLTSEEQDTIKLNESKLVDKKSVKEFIETMRKENARKTAEKDPKDVAYDELQVAWETAKDNKELADVKETLQKKSEEMMQIVDVENPDMSTAAELEEWLKINNSIGSKENEERNQKIGASLTSYFAQYDQDNGLNNLTPQQAAQIQNTADEIRANISSFDPFAVKEDGKLVDPRFESLKKFYDSLSLTDDNGKPISAEEKAKYLEEVKKLAREETITRLSTNPNYAQADAETKNKMILEGMLDSINESAASLLTAHICAQGQKTQEERQEEYKKLIELAGEGKPLPPIAQQTAEGALAGRYQKVVGISKRIAQKTEKRGLFDKINGVMAKWVEYQNKHPKMAIAINLGLTMGTNVLTGGAGLAVLGAFKTYEAIFKANEQRKQEGYEGGLLKYIGTHPRHIVSIVSNMASIGLSGWSAMQGLDANGLVGQAFNHGIGNAFDNVKAMGEGLWNTVTQPFSHATDAATVAPSGESMGFFANAGKKISNMFDSSNSLRFARTLRTVGVAGATFGLDVADVFKPENKGKRWKKLFGAFAKAAATGAAVWATTPTETMSAGMSAGAASAGAAAGAAGAAWDMDKSLTENIEANQFHPTMPGMEEPEIKVPYAPGMQPDANEYVESQENLTRWGNRIDQFLEKTGQADEIKDHIYGMIDKGEIKLPEGIETKEEYLYKMIMKMEQRPIDVTSELDAKLSTLSQEKMLASMSAEDFNKVSADLNDYSDKGVYHGSNTAGSEHHASHSHDKPIQRDLDEENKGLDDNNQNLTPPENNIIDITKGTMDKMFKDMFGGHINDEETLQSDLNQYHQMMTNGAYDQAEEYLKTIYNDHINPNGEYIPFEESQLLLANNDYKNALLGNSAVYFDEQQNQDPVMPELSELDKANKSFDETFRDVMGVHMREEDIQDNLSVYHEMMAKGDFSHAPEFLNHLIQGKDIDAAALNEAHHNVLSAMGREDDSFIGQDSAELEAARLADKQLVDELRIPEDQRDQVRFMDTGNGKGAYYINEDGSLSVSNNLGERMANESIHTPSTMTPEEHQHAQEKIIYDNLKNQENLSEGEKKFLDHYAKQESATPENAPQQEIKGQGEQTETVPQGNQEQETKPVQQDEKENNTQSEIIPEAVQPHQAQGSYFSCKYSINEQGNITITDSEQHGKVDDYMKRLTPPPTRDNNGVYHVGETKGSNLQSTQFAEAKRLGVSRVAIEHTVYHDLMERQEQGEVLNDGENLFMEKHQQDMKNYHLAENKEGNLVHQDKLAQEQTRIENARFNSTMLSLKQEEHISIGSFDGKNFSYALTEKGVDIQVGGTHLTQIEGRSELSNSDPTASNEEWAKNLRNMRFSDKSTGELHVGLAKGDTNTSVSQLETLNEKEITKITYENRLYQYLLGKENPTELEQNFMHTHESHLAQNHLVYDKETHTIQTDYKGLAKELDENNIKERPISKDQKQQFNAFMEMLKAKSGMSKIH